MRRPSTSGGREVIRVTDGSQSAVGKKGLRHPPGTMVRLHGRVRELNAAGRLVTTKELQAWLASLPGEAGEVERETRPGFLAYRPTGTGRAARDTRARSPRQDTSLLSGRRCAPARGYILPSLHEARAPGKEQRAHHTVCVDENSACMPTTSGRRLGSATVTSDRRETLVRGRV